MTKATLTIFGPGASWGLEDEEFADAPQVGDCIRIELEDVDQRRWPECKVSSRSHHWHDEDGEWTLMIYADLVDDDETPYYKSANRTDAERIADEKIHE